MFRTIMVPLDGSALAEQALPLAASIAHHTGGRLVLVQAVPLPNTSLVVGGEPIPVDEQVRRMTWYARHYLGTIQTQLRTHVAQHTAGAEPSEDDTSHPLEVSTRALIGDIGPVLVEYATELQTDLIVMATHGRSGPSRWAFGSVADKILQLSHIPVLAIRPTTTEPITLDPLPRLHRLLLPLDGSPLAEAAIPLAAELTRCFNAELTLFRAAVLPATAYISPDGMLLQSALWDIVIKEADAYLRQVAHNERFAGLHLRRVLTQNNVVTSLLSTADECHTDLIVMSTHGYTGLNRIVFGSVTDRVLRSGHHPVLFVRPNPKASPEHP